MSLGHDGCVVPFGKERILIMCALPIYPDELDLARNWGSEALFERMRAHGVTDRINLRRKNCARGGCLRNDRACRDASQVSVRRALVPSRAR